MLSFQASKMCHLCLIGSCENKFDSSIFFYHFWLMSLARHPHIWCGNLNVFLLKTEFKVERLRERP